MMGSTGREIIKRAASKVGVEILSRKGREDIARSHQSTIDEYVRLVAEIRKVSLPENQRRVPLMAKLVGMRSGEGAHLVACLNQVLALPGDVCECGVGSGATSALLANELRGSGKRLWLYDTFAGLPAPTAEDRLIDDIDRLGSMEAYTGRMSHPQIEVQTRLEAIDIDKSKYCLVPGLFETSVSAGRLPDRVCFAYVDFDFYAPIKLALEVISARLSPGGIIVVDDYGFFSEGAQIAVDNFVAEKAGEFSIEVPKHCHDRFAILRHVVT